MRRTQVPDQTGSSDLQAENARLRAALQRAEELHDELRTLVQQVTAAPWHPALFQREINTPLGRRALVWLGATSRLVKWHPDVAAEEFLVGDQVYLDHGQAMILARANGSAVLPSDTAAFVRFADDGRVVVRNRDDELLLECGGRFAPEALRAGHLVLFDRGSRIAFGSMNSGAGSQYLLEDATPVAPGAFGGDRSGLDELVAVLTAVLVEPELARVYGLDSRRLALLYGPPGCGKTLIVRTAAAEIARLSGRRCRFGVVRPGQFESPYVGETEQNIRACFAALREAAGNDLAVLFLDEIESICRIRGGAGGRHSDRFMAALLAEIDGFADRGRIALVAATNRRDLLDPALLSRLSEVEIPVRRPNRGAAREILSVHLPATLPYASPREELLDAAVALLYAPNAGNELCAIQLRDGTRRTICARELASGRLLSQIALDARQRAFRRQARKRGEGLCTSDAVEAVGDALGRLSTTLSVGNARAYLDDLPDDIDVVRVEPIRPRPERSQRYLHAF